MEQAVQTFHLTRTFGDFIAVNDVSLSIKAGSIYGFLGPNGSGKSTTIRMLCGILTPSSGSGTVMGLDITEGSEQIKQNIGYMSQKFSLYDDLTVKENLNFYAGMYGLSSKVKQERIDEMLIMAGLENRRTELTSTLSGGWKQRLALGCSIIHRPSVLFLDEPTGGVDPKSRRLFWDIIYQLAAGGTTVMVTTHFMDEAEHCDKIGFIYEGRLIADDRPDNLKKSIPGVLLAIPAADPIGMLADIASHGIDCIDSYPYNTSVHVLVAPNDVAAFARYRYEIITPSLEDVFVYYVKTERKELVL